MKKTLAKSPPVPTELLRHEVVLLDPLNERSLVNIVPDAVKDAIINIATNYPEFLDASEHELKRELQPDDADDGIRVSFWYEFVRAQDRGTRMRIGEVFSHFISDRHFYQTYLPNPRKVAWMICRPANYMMSLEAALNNGKDVLTKIMKMNIFDDQGNIKTKEAGLFLKAYEMLDNRVRGSVIQRIEQKTLSAHLNLGGDDEEKLQRLKELEDKHGGAIDVTNKPERA